MFIHIFIESFKTFIELFIRSFIRDALLPFLGLFSWRYYRIWVLSIEVSHLLKLLLQDEVVGARVGSVALGFERVPEPFLDDPFLPAHARFLEVRLLSNDVRHRWPSPRRRSRAR